jgi:outer membrane protein OmpA-like peptidoglycan-associated protein
VPGGTAAADPLQLGLFFGPRVFSTDSRLGYIADAPAHPMLANGIGFGTRVAKPFFPWLTPELELAVVPTHTDSYDVGVFWMNPRVHLRFDVLPRKFLHPFVVVGGGSTIALSSARKTFDSDLRGDGYLGGGLRFDTSKGFGFRLDARVSLVQGVDHSITPEVDVSFGLEIKVHEKRRQTEEELRLAQQKPSDRDGDGIIDSEDGCPDRAEDFDGFEDKDGCPDIDNDGDLVLDIADKCPNVPETYNGFEDDDGCPDAVPPDVDALRGTIEGLIYAAGETDVRDSAMPGIDKIAKVMLAHPSIKVVLIGHTDDREAKPDAPPAKGEEPPDVPALSLELGKERAFGARAALVKAGVNAGRVELESKGLEEPVAENDKPRGRLANRRVEIKLYVPKR